RAPAGQGADWGRQARLDVLSSRCGAESKAFDLPDAAGQTHRTGEVDGVRGLCAAQKNVVVLDVSGAGVGQAQIEYAHRNAPTTGDIAQTCARSGGAYQGGRERPTPGGRLLRDTSGVLSA